MKKLFYIPITILLLFSCNAEPAKKQSAVNESFEKNSQTMQSLFESFSNEAVDYSRFSDDVVFKGTLLGSKDSLKKTLNDLLNDLSNNNLITLDLSSDLKKYSIQNFLKRYEEYYKKLKL